MSTTSLATLEQLMAAQAQECVFEGLSLPALAVPNDCLTQLHLAQEAAQVRPGSLPRALSGQEAWARHWESKESADRGSRPGKPSQRAEQTGCPASCCMCWSPKLPAAWFVGSRVPPQGTA